MVVKNEGHRQGTRLRPLTLSAPKPMLPTAGLPFLTHMLSRIADAGIRHVVLGTSYKAEVFSDYFGDGSAFGLDLEYVVEDEPLGTGGGIRNVAGRLRYDTSVKEVPVEQANVHIGSDGKPKSPYSFTPKKAGHLVLLAPAKRDSNIGWRHQIAIVKRPGYTQVPYAWLPFGCGNSVSAFASRHAQ